MKFTTWHLICPKDILEIKHYNYKSSVCKTRSPQDKICLCGGEEVYKNPLKQNTPEEKSEIGMEATQLPAI